MKHKLHSFYVGVCYSLPVETGPEKVLLSRDRLEMCQKGFDDKPVICHVHFFMAFFFLEEKKDESVIIFFLPTQNDNLHLINGSLENEFLIP